jgi:hypothetical protein
MVKYMNENDEFKQKIRKLVLRTLEEYVRADSDLDLLSVQEDIQENVQEEVEEEEEEEEVEERKSVNNSYAWFTNNIRYKTNR